MARVRTRFEDQSRLYVVTRRCSLPPAQARSVRLDAPAASSGAGMDLQKWLQMGHLWSALRQVVSHIDQPPRNSVADWERTGRRAVSVRKPEEAQASQNERDQT